MPLSKLTHERYAHGATLTNAEVDELYEYYSGLNKAFGGYTPREYLLVENNVHSNYVRLKEMKEMRKATEPKSSSTKLQEAAKLYVRFHHNQEGFIQAWMNEQDATINNARTYWATMAHPTPEVTDLLRKAAADYEAQS